MTSSDSSEPRKVLNGSDIPTEEATLLKEFEDFCAMSGKRSKASSLSSSTCSTSTDEEKDEVRGGQRLRTSNVTVDLSSHPVPPPPTHTHPHTLTHVQIIQRLIHVVESDSFGQMIENSIHRAHHHQHSHEAEKEEEEQGEVGHRHCQDGVVRVGPTFRYRPEGRYESNNSLDSSYVMIEADDVIDSIAAFLAGTLMNDPRALEMKPKDLQRMVSKALADLRASRLKRLWSWGKLVWKGGVASYSMFQVYCNPWILEAVLRVVWLTGRVFGAL